MVRLGFKQVRRLFLLSLSASLMLGISLYAQSAPDLKQLRVNGTTVQVEDMSETPINGLYRLKLKSGDVVFSDAAGHYILTGDMYENTASGLVNLSETRASQERKQQLAKVASENMLVFRPAGKVAGELTIFTDVSCPYCHELHQNVASLNRKGIEVRYMAFPRTGLGSPAAAEMAQIWCSKNQQEALSAAFNGQAPSTSGRECANIISRDYDLGRQLGVQGTPAIIFPDGTLLPGYVPENQLLDMLKQHS